LSPLLEPFPSWQHNRLVNRNNNNNVVTLHSVLGITISHDVLYVLDQARVADVVYGPAKLVAFSITAAAAATSRSGGNVLLWSREFTDAEAPQRLSFLNDLRIWKTATTTLVYMMDSGIPQNASSARGNGDFNGALIVYDVHTDRVLRLFNGHVSMQPELALRFSVNRDAALNSEPMRTGADGIALSCDGDVLYWCPLTSRTLYAIRTEHVLAVLHDTMSERDAAQRIRALGNKLSTSDGLAFGASNTLYYTALEENAIYAIDREWLDKAQAAAAAASSGSGGGGSSTGTILEDHVQRVVGGRTQPVFAWPDTLSFDNRGALYFVTNQLNRFLDGVLSFDDDEDYNFRLWRVVRGDTSYANGCSAAHDDEQPTDKTRRALIIAAFSAGALFVFVLIAWGVRRSLARRRAAQADSAAAAASSSLPLDHDFMPLT
jgi:sugar lactone lactonase YvrE